MRENFASTDIRRKRKPERVNESATICREHPQIRLHENRGRGVQYRPMATRWIVESDIAKPKAWIDKAKRDKLEAQEAVEELRQGYTALNQTFEQQLQLERIGESDSMMKMMAEYMRLSHHFTLRGAGRPNSRVSLSEIWVESIVPSITQE
jgi:hypothetical protein